MCLCLFSMCNSSIRNGDSYPPNPSNKISSKSRLTTTTNTYFSPMILFSWKCYQGFLQRHTFIDNKKSSERNSNISKWSQKQESRDSSGDMEIIIKRFILHTFIVNTNIIIQKQKLEDSIPLITNYNQDVCLSSTSVTTII